MNRVSRRRSNADHIRKNHLMDDERSIVAYLPWLARKDDTDEQVELMFVEREGDTVYVRETDPCDPPPTLSPVYEGETIVVMTPISHSAVYSGETGDNLMFSSRLVPNDAPGSNNARVLRFGEHDDGRRVHVRPGGQVTFEPVTELLAINELESRGIEGYVPITPVLFTWFATVPDVPEERSRYLLAAARRLDRAQSLFTQAASALDLEPTHWPATRRALFEMIGIVELAVVSLSRAMDMCIRMRKLMGVATPVPDAVSTRMTAVTEIRNAYEHIEDRALGRVRNVPNEDAATIFEHTSLITDNVVTYGKYTLNLDSDVTEITDALRAFLLQATADAS